MSEIVIMSYGFASDVWILVEHYMLGKGVDDRDNNNNVG